MVSKKPDTARRQVDHGHWSVGLNCIHIMKAHVVFTAIFVQLEGQ